MSMRRYLFGGVNLPAPPSRDKNKYRNAIIYYYANDEGVEIAHYGYSDEPFYLDTTCGVVTNTAGATLYASAYNDGTGTWTDTYLFENAALALEPDKVIWTNLDLLDDTGALFLAASEPVLIETRPAPISLKMFCMGVLNGLWEEQSPICDAKPITGFSYSGVPLPKISDTELIGHKFAVICGGTAGKYHLYLFSARPHVLTSDIGEDIGFAVSSWFLTYKIFANYSTEDESVILAEWVTFETETIPHTGTIDYEISLEDPFVTDGILWSSFHLYGDDSVLRKKASYIYPVSEVIGNG